MDGLNIGRAAFKAYDIRGRVPDELNEELAYRLGRVFVDMFSTRQVVVGRDIRLSGGPLTEALSRGLVEAGADVIDIGLCGTEQVYFATFHLGVDGGIMVTASHNPRDYNGMKLVRKDARPVSGDSGLREIETRVVNGNFGRGVAERKGRILTQDTMKPYIKHLLSYVAQSVLKPLKVVVNAGHGCAGPVIDALETHLPFEFIKIQHDPDGTFPYGVPNPILPENRAATAEAVRETGADFGVAWDGDFDRCFLFDEQGEFVEGYYIVGFLAEAFLRRNPGAKIIHDPRLTWNTIELVEELAGIPVQTKTGHAFIKERMRLEDAVYGGEMSAHHYFRDFAYCDSGMIPWLLVAENICLRGQSLSALVGERMKRYPISGEINREVKDAQRVLAEIENRYAAAGAQVDRTDGLSIEYPDWRFNVRMSNTEPLLRLNIEVRGDQDLLRKKTAELLELVERQS